MKRGQLYAPGGYLLDCMGCDEQLTLTDSDRPTLSTKLWAMGWAYFRGWHCPDCAKECGIATPAEGGGKPIPK